jgi:two-component system, NtrC family, sensor kinase
LEKAVRLCDAERGFIQRQDGDVYRIAASYGHSDEFLEKITKQNPIHHDRSSATGRAVLERRVVHIHDILADPEYRWGPDFRSEKEMHRTILAAPMLKGDTIIGVIVIRRIQVQPFTEKHIALRSHAAESPRWSKAMATVSASQRRAADWTSCRTSPPRLSSP